MRETPSFGEARSFVVAQALSSDHTSAPDSEKPDPAITISREAGARGRTIGKQLIKHLRETDPSEEVPWTLFDEDLVAKVLEDHDLPKELEKFMPDDAVSEFEGSINEILGRHPSLWTLFEHTVDTIARLCHRGRCIVVGRGGNMITRGLPNVLRVRLIGSPANRTHQMIEHHGMSEREALRFIESEDAARRRYVKQHFGAEISEPALYDLVVNTDHMSDEAIVRMLAAAIDVQYPSIV